MFRNLFFAAVLAAICAGLVNSAIQHFRVIPLIIAAEAYEGAATHSHQPGTPAHSHEEEEWAPQAGLERSSYTVLANLLVAAGFALIIGAVSILLGLPITFSNGIIWGLGGFLVFQLAPAFGLAPELPGMAAGDLLGRQIWWAATVLSTGAAFLLVAKVQATWAFTAAMLLVAAPHIVGAPAAADHQSAVPAHLAASFAANALGAGAVFWAVLGLAFGKLNDLFSAKAA